MTLILTDPANGKQIAIVTSERAARTTARKYLGCTRVSEWAEADGWSYYPTGAPEDTQSVVRVTVR